MHAGIRPAVEISAINTLRTPKQDPPSGLPPVKDAASPFAASHRMDSGLAEALKSLEPFGSKARKQKQGNTGTAAVLVHHSALEAAFAGAAPIPAHARPGYAIQELPSVMGTVPESLYHQVHAPFTMALPGSKVKPGPHNLAQLAASPKVMAAAAQQAQAHSTRKLPPHVKYGSPLPLHGQQPLRSQRIDVALLREVHRDVGAPAPMLSSQVVVGSLVQHSSPTGSPATARMDASGRHSKPSITYGSPTYTTATYSGTPLQGQSSNAQLHAQPSGAAMTSTPLGGAVMAIPAGGSVMVLSTSAASPPRHMLQSDGLVWAASSSVGAAGSMGVGASSWGSHSKDGGYHSNGTGSFTSIPGSSGGWVFSSSAIPPPSMKQSERRGAGFISPQAAARMGHPPWPSANGSMHGTGTSMVTSASQSSGQQQQQQQPMRYPPFVYAYTPLAKPLPMGSSPVLRLHNGVAGKAGTTGTLMDLLTAAARATPTPTSSSAAAPIHHTGALLSAMIPNTPPTIDPGRGLTGHVGMGLQRTGTAATGIPTELSHGLWANGDASAARGSLAPSSPSVRSELVTPAEGAARALVGALYPASHRLSSPTSSPPIVTTGDVASTHTGSTTGARQPPATLPLRAAVPPSVRHQQASYYVLPPTRQVQARQVAAEVQLSHDLSQLVEGIRQDMSVPVSEEDVALKTKQTHHRTGPLRNLQPQQLLAPLLMPMTSPRGPDSPRVDTPSTSGLGATTGRTPMFDRRMQLGLSPLGDAEGAKVGTGSLRESLVGDGNGQAATAATVAVAPGGQEQADVLVPRLPANLMMDVAAAAQHAEQVAAAAAAAEAEAAATAGVAAALAAAAAVGSRPPTRQGLAEAVAVVGAALANAASQLLQTQGSLTGSLRRRMPLETLPEVLVVDGEDAGPALPLSRSGASTDRTATLAAALPPSPPAFAHSSPTAHTASGTAKLGSGALSATSSGGPSAGSRSVASSGSTGRALDALLEELVEGLGERPAHSMWQVQYQDGEDAPSAAAGDHMPGALAAAAVPTVAALQVARTAEPIHMGPSPTAPTPAVGGVQVPAASEHAQPCARSKAPTPIPDLLAPVRSGRRSQGPTLPPPPAVWANEGAGEDEGSEEYDETVEDEMMQAALDAVPSSSTLHSAHDSHPLSAPVVLVRGHSDSRGYGLPPARPARFQPAGADPAHLSGMDDEDGDTEYVDLDASDHITNRNSMGGATSRYSAYTHEVEGDGEEDEEDDEEEGEEDEEGADVMYDDVSLVGSEGHTTRRADIYSGVSLVRPYGSEAGAAGGEGGSHEYVGSEDGEQLSVSAYGIGPVQPLSSSLGRRNSRGPASARSQHDNDILLDNGMRLLGKRYEVQHVVGEGAYGMVMKCRVRGSDPEHYVACKEFKIEDDDPDADDVKRTSKREVALLKTLQHPNVVQFIDEFFVRDRLFIVMEFVPCNLLELLEAQPGGMDREAVRLIMYQLCTAITYIHSKSVVYRDIKPENVLVDENGRIKLCDFGFARFVTGAPGEHLTDYVATRWYRAPELLLGPPFHDEGAMVQSVYGPPIDMWAIGCLMGELMDGEPLFAGDSDLDQLYRIQQLLGPVTQEQQALFARNPANAGISFNFKQPLSLATRYEDTMNEVELDFMACLLHMDPAKRMTGAQALQHPYLADLALTDERAPSSMSNTSTSSRATRSARATDMSGGATMLLGSVVLGSQQSTRVGSPIAQLAEGHGPGSYVLPSSPSMAAAEHSQFGAVGLQGSARSSTSPQAAAHGSARNSAAGPRAHAVPSQAVVTAVTAHAMSGRRSAVLGSGRASSTGGGPRVANAQHGSSPSARGQVAGSARGISGGGAQAQESVRHSASRASSRLSSALAHASYTQVPQ